MILRKLAAGVLALPTLARIYARLLSRRGIAGRVALVAAPVALVGAGTLGFLASNSAAQPQPSQESVAQALFSPFLTDQSLDAPITIKFSGPMNRSSVAAALSVTPAAQVHLVWDASSRTLSVTPATNWSPATDYTITVGTSAKDARGHRLPAPARQIFLTRAATTGILSAVVDSSGLVRADAQLRLSFDRPVATASVRSAFTIDPAIGGVLTPGTSGATSATFTFVPSAPWPGGGSLSVGLAAGVVDADGGAVAPVQPLALKVVAAPAVVRSRPSGGASNIAATALLSVRFTVPMDRTSTTQALSVTKGGRAIAGAVSWSEHDTVVAFDPSKPLPAGSTVRFAVTTAARSAEGAALLRPLGITFTVAAATKTSKVTTTTSKPATKPATKPVTKPAPPPPSGGATAGSAPWHAVETYFLGLLNCTRTGNWVSASGACGATPSGLTVRPPAPPLALDAGISTNVSRPYAKYLATHGLCNHFYDGSPGDRLRRAGYPSYRWGENIGCPYGNPTAGMVAVERFFQNETPSGGHYVNLMNPLYDRAGIGVWVSSGRVRVVIDFYHP